MESCSPPRLNRGCALLVALTVLWGCSQAAADARGVGERIPRELGEHLEEGADLVWVLRPEDYLTCQTAADAIRRAQRLHGRSLRVTVIPVGSHAGWAAAFLSRQRINADIRPLSQEQFLALFGQPSAAMLYLTRDGVIQHAVSTSPQGDSLADVPRLLKLFVPGSGAIRGGADQLSPKEES